jgi:hypothetical protein
MVHFSFPAINAERFKVISLAKDTINKNLSLALFTFYHNVIFLGETLYHLDTPIAITSMFILTLPALLYKRLKFAPPAETFFVVRVI